MGKIYKGVVLLAALLMMMCWTLPSLAVDERIIETSVGTEPSAEESSDTPEEPSEQETSTAPSVPSAESSEPEESENQSLPDSVADQQPKGTADYQSYASHAQTRDYFEESVVTHTFQWTEDMKQSLENAISWMKMEDPGAFYLVSLGIVGGGTNASIAEMYLKNIQGKTGDYDDGVDLAVDILGITFSGASASSFRNINLIDTLADYKIEKNRQTETAAWFLIALDSNNYTVSSPNEDLREDLVSSLLQNQNEDGGFGKEPGADSDISLTAMVVTALSTYTEDSLVKPQVSQALSFLSDVIQEDDFYQNHLDWDSETASKLVIGLSSLGMDLNDERFCLDDKNMVELLLEYGSSEGGFSRRKNSALRVDSTEMAVIALYAAENAMDPYKTQNAIENQSFKPVGGFISTEPPEEKSPGLIIFAIAFLVAGGLAVFVWFQHKKKHAQFGEAEREENPYSEVHEQKSPAEENVSVEIAEGV